MKTRLRLTMIAAIMVLILMARSRGGSTTRAAPRDEVDSSVLHEVRFDHTPLQKVIDKLAEQSGTHFSVDWKSLAEDDVTRDTPVTLHLFDLPLRKVLTLTFDLATDGSREKVGYEVLQDGTIHVASAYDIPRKTVVRMYDVSKLIEPDLAVTPSASTAAVRQSNLDALLRTVEETIDPDSWRDNGGQIGGLKEFGGQLVVVQTPKNHRGVQDFIDQLTRMHAARATGHPTTLPIEMGNP